MQLIVGSCYARFGRLQVHTVNTRIFRPPLTLSNTPRATRRPSKLDSSTRWWSLMTCDLSCKKCRSRISPSDLNSAGVVRFLKAPWDRFITGNPQHRESSATMQCRSRYFYPPQRSAVHYNPLVYTTKQQAGTARTDSAAGRLKMVLP